MIPHDTSPDRNHDLPPNDSELPSIEWGSQPLDTNAPAHTEIDMVHEGPGYLDPVTSLDPALEPVDLLEIDSPLDPSRQRVDMARLHPDHFEPSARELDARLEAIMERDASPEAWIGSINPGFIDDATHGRIGRTENCADCARSVQDTIDGRPHTAAAISQAGLDLVDGTSGGGEHSAYTEQWAGARMIDTSYGEIERELSRTGSSAIIHADGPRGGHAFNAMFDTERSGVRWLDGQTGETGPWPPEHMRKDFPSARAIYFPPRSTR